VNRACFKEKIMNHVSGVPSRSVSVLLREMGGKKTQAKIDNYFANQSAKRQTKPIAYPYVGNQ